MTVIIVLSKVVVAQLFIELITYIRSRYSFITQEHFLQTALGIEILCISAAVIGENSAFYLFGYNLLGIILGYVMGYIAAGFATFMTILGRYDLRNAKIDICCSVLEQQSSKGFLTNLVMTFGNFVLGFSKLPYLHTHPHLRRIYYIG